MRLHGCVGSSKPSLPADNISTKISCLTIYLINTCANRADPDQAALVRADLGLLCLLMDMIRYDPTLVDLTSNFFVLFTNMKIYIYNYS